MQDTTNPPAKTSRRRAVALPLRSQRQYDVEWHHQIIAHSHREAARVACSLLRNGIPQPLLLYVRQPGRSHDEAIEIRESLPPDPMEAVNTRLSCNVDGRLKVVRSALILGDDNAARGELLQLLAFVPSSTATVDPVSASPFALPCRFDGDALVADDHELILMADGATEEEKAFITDAINSFTPEAPLADPTLTVPDIIRHHCAALSSFITKHYPRDDDHNTSVRDLLTDLQHYCAQHDIDFDEQSRIAHDNYLSEEPTS